MQFIRWNFYLRVMWWISYDPIISDFCILLTSHWLNHSLDTLLIGSMLPFWTFWQLTCRQLCSHIKYLNENEFNIRKLHLLGFFLMKQISRCIYNKSCNSANPAALNQNCLSGDEVWIHPSSLLEYIHHSDYNEEPLYWNLQLFMFSFLSFSAWNHKVINEPEYKLKKIF